MNKLNLKLIIITLFFMLLAPVYAADANYDEIQEYSITVEVNPDATVNINYNIKWEVLDSNSAGPLTWVSIGVPNNHCDNITATTGNIKNVKFSNANGSFVEVYFEKKYYKGEVVDFGFSIHQDYIYQMNLDQDGYTTFEFTPGWFDDIEIDKMTVRWNADKASGWSPSCFVENGYLTWTKNNMSEGERFTVNVNYPNDAFAFDTSKRIAYSDYESDYDDDGDTVAVIIFVIIFAMGLLISARAGKNSYNSGAGLGTEYDTKITRTRIEYYPSCQGCGAVREEGQNNCTFCGRSFIKSEEVIREEDIPKGEEKLIAQKKDGVYKYDTIPNTYVRVNVVRVPRPRVRTTSHSGGCAHSSCACACACACAGGGRAGCSTKDFYNTNLKLRQLELKNLKHK